MSNKSGIKKIILTVAGKEITLTLEDAKELKNALEQMFPKPEKEVVYVDRFRSMTPYPFYYWNTWGTWTSSSMNVSLSGLSSTNTNGESNQLTTNLLSQ